MKKDEMSPATRIVIDQLRSLTSEIENTYVSEWDPGLVIALLHKAAGELERSEAARLITIETCNRLSAENAVLREELNTRAGGAG